MSDESIFAAALNKAPGVERRAFLDGACGSDHELRGRIERLLEADDQTAGILEPRPRAGPTDAPRNGPLPAPTSSPGRPPGEGGMEVWSPTSPRRCKRRRRQHWPDSDRNARPL